MLRVPSAAVVFRDFGAPAVVENFFGLWLLLDRLRFMVSFRTCLADNLPCTVVDAPHQLQFVCIAVGIERGLACHAQLLHRFCNPTCVHQKTLRSMQTADWYVISAVIRYPSFLMNGTGRQSENPSVPMSHGRRRRSGPIFMQPVMKGFDYAVGLRHKYCS